MSLSNRLIILSSILFVPTVNAFDISVDALYWRATESFDWVMINDRNVPHQNVSYKTANFQFEPGFRVGVGTQGEWDTLLSYTRYHTDMSSTATGKLTPTLLASKMAQPNGAYFYQSGNINFAIHYNVIDAELAKTFEWDRQIEIQPFIGLRGAWIDQSIDTRLQGDISVSENVENNFKGVGPKAGINTAFTVYRCNQSQFQLFANFATAYLWGHWSINDALSDNNNRTILIENKNRNQASVGFETALGLKWNYQNWSLNFSYEMSDWLNQFQIFDDGTGGHSNDLVLQGLRAGFTYQFPTSR